MVRECSGSVEREEEEVLDDNGGARDECRRKGGVFLETSPGEIDVEEEEQNSEANDRSLESYTVSWIFYHAVLVCACSWDHVHQTDYHRAQAD